MSLARSLAPLTGGCPRTVEQDLRSHAPLATAQQALAVADVTEGETRTASSSPHRRRGGALASKPKIARSGSGETAASEASPLAKSAAESPEAARVGEGGEDLGGGRLQAGGDKAVENKRLSDEYDDDFEDIDEEIEGEHSVAEGRSEKSLGGGLGGRQSSSDDSGGREALSPGAACAMRQVSSSPGRSAVSRVASPSAHAPSISSKEGSPAKGLSPTWEKQRGGKVFVTTPPPRAARRIVAGQGSEGIVTTTGSWSSDASTPEVGERRWRRGKSRQGRKTRVPAPVPAHRQTLAFTCLSRRAHEMYVRDACDVCA